MSAGDRKHPIHPTPSTKIVSRNKWADFVYFMVALVVIGLLLLVGIETAYEILTTS